MEAWDQDASVVLPSRDGRYYSTRITGPDGARPHPLDGSSAGNGHTWGSGNPGDDNAQLGLHIEVVGQAADGKWGAIRVYNARMDYELGLWPAVARVGDKISVTLSAANGGAVETPVTYTLSLPAGLEYVEGHPVTGARTVAPGARLWAYVVAQVTDAAALAPGRPLKVEAIFDDGTDRWRRTVVLRAPERVLLPAAINGVPIGGGG
ncbi:MAG: hypothetical protein ACE5EL_01135, partial [Anaerolineae bacterium]